RDPDPVEGADGKPEAGDDETGDSRRVREARADECTADVEPRRDRVQALRAIDVDVEERVEEIEAGDPERDGRTEHPGLPRKVVRDRDPRSDRRKAVDDAQPEVAEPGPAPQVGVDHE